MDVITITSDAEGRTRVERRLPRSTRLLFAGVLGGFAAWFLHYFVSAFRYFLATATREEWSTATPGFGLIAVGFLVFAIPTWLFLFRRTILIVDPASRTIVRLTDYLVLRRRREVPFARVASVAVTTVVAHRNRNVRVYYPVRVMLDDDTTVLAARAGEKAHAEELRRRLSRLMGVHRQRNLGVADR